MTASARTPYIERNHGGSHRPWDRRFKQESKGYNTLPINRCAREAVSDSGGECGLRMVESPTLYIDQNPHRRRDWNLALWGIVEYDKYLEVSLSRGKLCAALAAHQSVRKGSAGLLCKICPASRQLGRIRLAQEPIGPNQHDDGDDEGQQIGYGHGVQHTVQAEEDRQQQSEANAENHLTD